MNVLICDDDRTTRLLARRLLEGRFGCRVSECADGLEALRTLACERVSLLLLDVEMPTLDGLATLEEVRASPATRDLAVIVLSSNRDERNVRRSIELGISDYIVKPLHTAAAIAKIGRVLGMVPLEVGTGVDHSANQLGSKARALLVDGSAEFRQLASRELQTHGPVVEADSAAAAIVAFRRSPSTLVFVGGDLGVVTEERLLARLREMSGDDIRLVRILKSDDERVPDGYHGSFVRSNAPETLRARLQPFVGNSSVA